MVLLRLGGQGLEFVAWIVFARRLGSSAFGDLVVPFLIARYAGLFADWGASFRGARDVAAEGRHGSIGRFVRRRTQASLGLGASGVLLALAVHRPGLAPMVLVVLGLGLSRDWIALGREQGARAGMPAMLQGLVILVCSLWASTTTQSIAAVGAGYGLAAVVSVLLNPVGEEPPDTVAGRAHGWILAAVLANQMTSTADTVLLHILRSSSQAGIYAAVYRIPNAWYAVLTQLLGSLLPIAMSSRLSDREGHDRLQRRSLRVSALGALLILALTPVSWVLSGFIFGPAYDSGRTALLILMMAAAVITLAAPLHPFAMSTGHDRRYALILVGGAVGNLVANLAVIPAFGMIGAASTTLGAQLVVSALLWRLVRQQARVNPVSDRPDEGRSEPSGRSPAHPS